MSWTSSLSPNKLVGRGKPKLIDSSWQSLTSILQKGTVFYCYIWFCGKSESEMLRMKITILAHTSSPINHWVPVYSHDALFMGKIQALFITQFQLYFHHSFSKNIFIYSLAIIYTLYIHKYTYICMYIYNYICNDHIHSLFPWTPPPNNKLPHPLWHVCCHQLMFRQSWWWDFTGVALLRDTTL